ncbi:formylglycine-generating enzyme family protein [Myxococcus llanfairpwllgwyngyllgogerychwyrndrobwllllantysiliogogogochensis]|uniref:Formylglycine-generating enzyme family protein n=1 Tax=Myxococcus llanfairpwllgwyngyllgogerychwyrndrobwllllantysiliogogogochensis TaxID=2590453 RepID=A0A540X408_9BACT|nr:formylglycine-generating enzyme family protein [Myxococcus llanfairpwllgwyngyllgogerychwyrndrobwllllantysiliogogogochensis]TQF15991.1 formylglycine-generating enzyme family protein [Myxococcus llanfairpwllgwyngyllgogerychwyrndrobwllllantysiliogogogochensis]
MSGTEVVGEATPLEARVSRDGNEVDTDAAPGDAPFPGMAWIPGGTYWMGSDHHYPEERPAHQVTVSGFWMDRHTVTNADFARFVEATGYLTVAERPLNPDDFPGAAPELLVPGSLVFRKAAQRVDLKDLSQWWAYTPGACWKLPEGHGSTWKGRESHPVLHVAYEDAEAYAAWVGKALPSEAEWERAARAGLDRKVYVWGDEFSPGGQHMANIWQGEFPWQNLNTDGFEGTSPVGTFPPNGYGLFDMAGNVWEWTTDWFQERHQGNGGKACCIPVNPRGPPSSGKSLDPCTPQVKIPRRVLKGGSHLCASNYCLRYRPAARSPQAVDSGTTHIGFRCLVRVPEK